LLKYIPPAKFYLVRFSAWKQ